MWNNFLLKDVGCKQNFFLTVYPIDFENGKTYVIIVGCLPGVYDTWEEGSQQVHQSSNAESRPFIVEICKIVFYLAHVLVIPTQLLSLPQAA